MKLIYERPFYTTAPGFQVKLPREDKTVAHSNHCDRYAGGMLYYLTL